MHSDSATGRARGASDVVVATSEKALGSVESTLLLRAIERSGVRAREVVWETVDLAPRGATEVRAHETVVIGHTWDYHLRLPSFRAWLGRLRAAGVRVHNAIDLVEWNLDKRYLLELGSAGVPIPPTVVVGSDSGSDSKLDPFELDGLADRLGATTAVIKPTVSATAWRTRKVDLADRPAVREAVEDAARSGTAIAQAFIPEIRDGEWSLIYLGGTLSHAVLKRAKPGDFRVQSDFGGSVEAAVPPSGAVEVAGLCLAALPSVPTLARVDVVGTPAGFLLMELELIEPDLFLRYHDSAPTRLAELITDPNPRTSTS